MTAADQLNSAPAHARYVLHWLSAALLVFVLIVFGTSFELPHLGMTAYEVLVAAWKLFWFHLPRAFPLLVGAVGVAWTLHLIETPVTAKLPQLPLGPNILGIVVTFVVGIVYFMLLPRMLTTSTSAAFVAAVYVALTLLLFAFWVAYTSFVGVQEPALLFTVLISVGFCFMSGFLIEDRHVRNVAVTSHLLSNAIALLSCWRYLTLFEESFKKTQAQDTTETSSPEASADVEEQAWA